jgi:hypothetical protein
MFETHKLWPNLSDCDVFKLNNHRFPESILAWLILFLETVKMHHLDAPTFDKAIGIDECD